MGVLGRFLCFAKKQCWASVRNIVNKFTIFTHLLQHANFVLVQVLHNENKNKVCDLISIFMVGVLGLCSPKGEQFGGRRLDKSKTSFGFILGSYTERTFGSRPSTLYNEIKNKTFGLIFYFMVGVLGLEPRTLRV